jgi:hypothetical protein
MADDLRAKLILDDKEALGPLRRVGDEAKRVGDEHKRAGDKSKQAGSEGAKAQEEFARKTKEAAEVAGKLAREVGKLNAKAVLNEAKQASDSYQAALARVAATQKKVSAETSTMATSTNQATSGVRLMGAGAAAAYTQIAQAAAAAVAKTVEFAKAIWDAGRAGARITDLQNAFKALGGTDAEMSALRESVNGTVGDAQLIKFRNMGVALGIPSEKFGVLAKTAQNAALATGQSFDFMLDSVVRGTARESALILDNLGIKLQNAQQQIDAQFKAMGVTAEEATAKQKSLAFIAVVEANAANLKVVGGLESEAAAYAQVEAAMDNAIASVQQNIAAMLANSGAFEVANEVIARTSKMFDENKEAIGRFIDNGIKFIIEMLPLAEATVSGLMAALDVGMTILGPLIPILDITAQGLMLPIKLIALLIEEFKKLHVVRDIVYSIGEALKWLSDRVDGLLSQISSWAADLGLVETAQLNVLSGSEMLEEAINRQKKAHDAAAEAALKQLAAEEQINKSYTVDTGRGFGFGTAEQDKKNKESKELQDYRDRVFKGKGAKSQPGQWGDTPGAIGSLGDTLGGVGSAAMGGVGSLRGLMGTRAAPNYSERFGLDGLADRASFGVRSNLGDAWGTMAEGVKQGQEKAKADADEMKSAAESAMKDMEALAEATRKLGDDARTSLVNGFLGAFDAIVGGMGSFREQMFGVMGGMMGELATAFGAWATAEGALLAGQPWLALGVVGLMKLAASRVSAFGKRSSGGGGNTESQASRYMARKSDSEANRKTIYEFNINTIPVPDRIARELATSVARGFKLQGAS